MLIHWLWLATRQNLNDWEKATLLQHFQDPEDIYFADSAAMEALGVKDVALLSLLEKDLSPAEQILAQCAQKDIRICTMQDAAYPARLKNISDPPLVLYYKGNLPDLDNVPAIGLVGTRKASAYGMKTSKNMGYQIAKCGAVLISGLAEGNDSAGATGALMAGGTVVGVLGCGADVVYPARNRSLYADTQRSGCLLTEFPPGTPPYKWNFPRRNRLISGLSCGVLVVEAPERSGSLITARQAAEQGRDVFVVPGNIDVGTFTGSNGLLREGAVAVTCGWDVVGEYAHLYPGKVRCYAENKVLSVGTSVERKPLMVAQNTRSPEESPVFDGKKEKKPIDNGKSQSYSDIHNALSEEDRLILSVLQKGDCLPDDVVAQTGLPTAKVMSALTLLQINGIIIKKPGNILSLK